MDSKTSLCENCGKPLAGRTDKRFCHDGCRNTYNRIKKQAEQVAAHENLPEIFKIIKRNYELIQPRGPLDTDQYIFHDDVSDLLAQGFNPKFFTSVYTDKYGKTWNCIFDVGFHLDDQMIDIGWFPNQADTSINC